VQLVLSASEILTRVLYMHFSSVLSDPFVRRVPILFLPYPSTTKLSNHPRTPWWRRAYPGRYALLTFAHPSHHAGRCRHRSTNLSPDLPVKADFTDPRRALPGICSEYAIDRNNNQASGETCLVLWKLLSVYGAMQGRLPLACESHLHDRWVWEMKDRQRRR